MKKREKKDISAQEKVQTSETNHIPLKHDKSAGTDHAEGRPAEAGKSTEYEDRKLIDEKLLRLRADFDNFRKRMLREKNELYRRANEELILELLPVFDHLDLALAAAEKHEAHGTFIEGFSLVSEQLMSVLKKFGLTPIDAEGLKFDPERHEAISYIHSDKFPENAVITQVRRGYMLGGKLLRAAQVVVSGGEQRTATSAPPLEGPSGHLPQSGDVKDRQGEQRNSETKKGETPSTQGPGTNLEVQLTDEKDKGKEKEGK